MNWGIRIDRPPDLQPPPRPREGRPFHSRARRDGRHPGHLAGVAGYYSPGCIVSTLARPCHSGPASSLMLCTMCPLRVRLGVPAAPPQAHQPLTVKGTGPVSARAQRRPSAPYRPLKAALLPRLRGVSRRGTPQETRTGPRGLRRGCGPAGRRPAALGRQSAAGARDMAVVGRARPIGRVGGQSPLGDSPLCTSTMHWQPRSLPVMAGVAVAAPEPLTA